MANRFGPAPKRKARSLAYIGAMPEPKTRPMRPVTMADMREHGAAAFAIAKRAPVGRSPRCAGCGMRHDRNERC